MVELACIYHARRILASHFTASRLVRALTLSTGQRDVHLKLESELPTGSFKVRGAVYALTVNAERRSIAEVVAASTGNHGAAVAYAGRLLDIRATIFLPAGANPAKIVRILDLGARIVEAGRDLSAAIDAADAYCACEGAFFLHDARDPDIPAGAGTIGVEIVAQLPMIDAVYVPMGDTALVRGVASAIKQLRASTRIVGVVAERAPAYYRSWLDGRVIETETADTIADGLAVTRPLAPNVAAIRELVDRVVLVKEEEMMNAIRWLAAHEQVIAEPAGAAATAALRQEDPSNGTIALLVTGANIAPDVLRRATEPIHL
jgi:threonine dehydratase